MKKCFLTYTHVKFFTQLLFRYSLLSGVLLTFFLSGKAQNLTITPGSNPSSVVLMGDSLVFSTVLLSDASINNAELEVDVPAGFELLASTPNLKSGSLSGNKRIGRILVASLPQTTPLTLTVYVKALCNAETATPLVERKIRYRFYLSASAVTPLATTTIYNGIQNFNHPILNITYPASEVVPLNADYTRTFTVVQTRNYSHVNNMQVTAQCSDPTGFNISKVEVRRNAGKAWTEVEVESIPAGYRYTIKRDDVFTPANGYSNRQLGYNDTLLIRETVSLRKCDRGSLNYSVAYGDGVSFCSPAASTGNVTYSQPVYTYTADIYQSTFYNPGGPASDGRYVTCIHNKSAQAEATMHDLYVQCSNVSNYIFKSAYFTNANGAPILNGTDTVFIYMTSTGDAQYRVVFDSLNKPALATYYQARGLRDLDGDGRYSDLPKDNSFHFAIRYNYVTNTGTCPNGIVGSTTRIFRLYYKTFCRGSYQDYVRNYQIGETNGGSTNAWQGYIMFSSIRDIAISPANLQNNGQARVSGMLYFDGNGSVTSTRGSNLFNLAVTGVSRYFSTIVLPAGLSFDNTQTNPVRIGSSLAILNANQYTVSPGRDTIRIQWTTSSWGANNYKFDIAVRNNGTVDNDKTIRIYHEYGYGNTGVLQKFGCVNVLVPYLQMLPCSYLGITSFNIERRSFGYTHTNKITRVTDPDVARGSGFNMKIVSPFDNVDVEGKFKAGTNISTGNTNQIQINFSYIYDNSNPLFDIISGSSNGISLYYNDRTTPVQIPSSAMSKTWTNATKTQQISVNIAPYLNAANITALKANDSLKVVMHLRATTALPTTGVDLYAQMQPVTVIGNNTNRCSPLTDKVRIWNSDWSNKLNCSGGMGQCISNFYHYNSYNASALDMTIYWSTGQDNVWGSEYRPNGDNFSAVVSRYPNLLRINSVTMLANGLKGNMTNNSVLTKDTDYEVTYSNGETYVTIKKGVTKDYMSSTSSTGFGYRINFDIINPTADNNTGYMPYYFHSLAFDNYPTSASPRRDTLNATNGSIQANGGLFNYPYRYAITPLPVNAVPISARAEWTVRITNQSSFIADNSNLPNSWLAVECPPGVVPQELRNASTNTPVNALFEQYASGVVNKYWIKIGTIAANPNADYILSCTYAVCTGAPQLTVKYGMSKVAYPTNPDSGYSQYGSPGRLAGVVSTNISYTPPAVKFAGRLSHRPNTTNNANIFCDSVTFEGEYSNALTTNVSRLQLRVTMPPGTSYYSAYTPEVKFGNGTWTPVASVDESTFGELLITLDDSKELLAFGSSNNNDRAWVRYALHIGCGIENGTQFPVEFIGRSGCGTVVSEYAVDVAPLEISGILPPPDYWVQNMSLTSNASAPYIFTGNALPINGEISLSGRYVLANDAAANVIAIIDLPPNLRMTSFAGDFSLTQDGSDLIADLPDSGAPGTIYEFQNIRLVPENPAQWLEDSVTIYIRTGKKVDMSCNSQNCVMTDKTTIDSIKFALKKLDIRFSETITARSSYSNSVAERVVIDGKLVNNGISSYFDADVLNLDLWYRNGTSWTPVAGATGLQVNNVIHNDSVAFRIIANVPYNMNVCNMVVVLRRNNFSNNAKNPWLADSVAIVVPTPVYEITSQPAPICQMAVNTPVGDNAITGYSYQWSPATYLSGGGNGTTLNFTYDYRTSPLPDGATLQYLVNITRPHGCTSVDTVFVNLKGIPAVQPVADIAVCHGEGLSVSFEDNTGSGVPVTEFHWTIESLNGNISGTGLPTSGIGDINVSPLVNTGASIVARCIVTPRKDGCNGVADTFNIRLLSSSMQNYPDIRLNACRGMTVNLSKYIDTIGLQSLVWKSVYPLPISPSGEVVIDKSHQPGVATFTYEATNLCLPTAPVRKVYVRILSNDIRQLRDSIAICYKNAEALQINQIFGIEADGTFGPFVADDGSDLTPYIKESSTYSTTTMNGKAIYENTSARKVTITYTPAAGSCLNGKIFTITIILTDV
jgi:hypothetical protein